MAVIGGPPLLRIGHRGLDVSPQRFEIKLLELLGVVEVGAHRVGLRRVVAEDAEIELVRPPVVVRSAAGGAGAVSVSDWALGFAVHDLVSCG
ncbi:unannotated protein [freshwater metagenome]|uniref:Unannotated protein n=1 Tax=freshwater metagenome TaxID=449393 RepID=A0A6J7S6S0_9ZZZZ